MVPHLFPLQPLLLLLLEVFLPLQTLLLCLLPGLGLSLFFLKTETALICRLKKNPTKITRDFYNVGEAIHWSYCLQSYKECFPCSFKQFHYLQLHKTYTVSI